MGEDRRAEKVGDPFRTSKSSRYDDIEKFLNESPNIDTPSNGKYEVASHVETKLSWSMRNAGVKNLDVVINHQRGPCIPEVADYTCRAAVPAILPKGSTLMVWHKDAAGILRNIPLHGVGPPVAK
ncbi:DddA-like double-stranded DNA deaminase toxin [Streptomyces sp. NPDC093228]|uniref:DddA-like double-stranded DNA deaminase toxin n=1 Tax=Streptomyces sp. NPDC093228 TaxID=3155070 RepID=UPI003443F185